MYDNAWGHCGTVTGHCWDGPSATILDLARPKVGLPDWDKKKKLLGIMRQLLLGTTGLEGYRGTFIAPYSSTINYTTTNVNCWICQAADASPTRTTSQCCLTSSDCRYPGRRSIVWLVFPAVWVPAEGPSCLDANVAGYAFPAHNVSDPLQ